MLKCFWRVPQSSDGFQARDERVLLIELCMPGYIDAKSTIELPMPDVQHAWVVPEQPILECNANGGDWRKTMKVQENSKELTKQNPRNSWLKVYGMAPQPRHMQMRLSRVHMLVRLATCNILILTTAVDTCLDVLSDQVGLGPLEISWYSLRSLKASGLEQHYLKKPIK